MCRCDVGNLVMSLIHLHAINVVCFANCDCEYHRQPVLYEQHSTRGTCPYLGSIGIQSCLKNGCRKIRNVDDWLASGRCKQISIEMAIDLIRSHSSGSALAECCQQENKWRLHRVNFVGRIDFPRAGKIEKGGVKLS